MAARLEAEPPLFRAVSESERKASKLKMFDRDSAFSMEIRNPDDHGDESPIVQMLMIGNEMLVFKETSIHRGLPADTIDPERSDLSTRHSSEMPYSVGTSNSFVARMILQFKEMIGLAISQTVRESK